MVARVLARHERPVATVRLRMLARVDVRVLARAGVLARVFARRSFA